MSTSLSISDIQLHIFVSNYYETQNNVVYIKNNPDGTRDKIERVWKSGQYAAYYNMHNNVGNGNFYISPDKELLNYEAPNGLRAFILDCEKAKKFPLSYRANEYGSNGLFTGTLVSKVRLPPTQEQIAAEQAKEMKKLAEQVSSLAKTTTTLVTTNEKKDKEIEDLKALLAQTSALLKSALGS